MALQVRERPPLRLSIDAQTPSGSHFRWGQDEPKAANVPSDLIFTSSMPGGFESLNCTLPRKPEREYSDLERFTNLRVLGPGGAMAWEGRLESSPRVSGDQMAVSPGAVGWQAHLEDDTSARMIYVDRDLGSWQPMSRQRRVNILTGVQADVVQDFSTEADAATGLASLSQAFSGPWGANGLFCEAWYDAGPGLTLGDIYHDWEHVGSATFVGRLDGAADDVTISNAGTDRISAAPSTGTNTETAAEGYRCAVFRLNYAGAVTSAVDFYWNHRQVTVWGNHGLTKRGSTPADGLYASDVIAHAVRTWAPLLTLTTGSSGSVTDSSFVIPQLAFKDPTTAADIIQGANRYHLRDWAVWEDRTFYYHERGARGRSWRARVGPAQLSETGPSIENLWNGVIVKYSDVDGTTKTVGPTGSGCDTTSTSVMDSDPLNPANELGIHRWTQIDMGGVSTAAGATEVGRRFLIEAAQYNASGQAQLVGHVEDDRGVLHPAWRVRAGDTITFVDAASTTPRRIVKASYSHASRTCSVDLDAPPDGLDSLLARLQISIAPLGL